MEAQKRKLKHKWHRLTELLKSETANYFVCKRCGMVQNENNVSGQCRGKMKMRVPERPLEVKNEAKESET